VAWFFITLTAIAVLGVIGFTVFGSGSIFGIGRNAFVCCDTVLRHVLQQQLARDRL